MSKVYKCNRCGKYYDEYCADISVNQNAIIKVSTDYDLCENCFEELQEFLNYKEEK